VRLLFVMFYIYCLQSKKVKEELYFGYTNNLKKRITEHNKGQTKSSKRYKPWKLIYYEACLSESDAKRREKYLKTNIGRRMFKKRIRDYWSAL
jgi:putative endonuclease